MGAVRRSRALCARPNSGGQALLGVSQPQTTGDGRLFQRKIVGAATIPSRGRGGAPSWPEVRGTSLSVRAELRRPIAGVRRNCHDREKRRPVLRCHDWVRRCRRRGVLCRNGRKEGWKEEWGGGMRPILRTAALRGYRRRVGSVSRGWKDAAGRWRCRRARKIFTRTKTRNATTEVAAFLEKGVEAPMAFANAQTSRSGRSKAEDGKTSLRLRCGPACQRP